MTTTLDPRALFNSGTYDLHHPRTTADIAFEQAPDRLNEFDPDGCKALALLDKIESQSQ